MVYVSFRHNTQTLTSIGQGGGGQGGSGITGVTRTNMTANVQVLVRNFFQACGLNFPQTIALGGAGGQGGGLGGGGGFGGGAQLGAGGANPDQDQKALFFNDRTGILFVRATLSDLDIIEKAIQILNVAPPQIEIEARFAEISQTDNKALGFDWLMGNILLGGGKSAISGGSAPSFAGAPSAANPGSTSADGSQILPGGVFPGTTPLNLATPGANDQLITGGHPKPPCEPDDRSE